jgi:hypothetical protein
MAAHPTKRRNFIRAAGGTACALRAGGSLALRISANPQPV